MEHDKIVELLKKKEVTQTEIADELGVRQPTVNQVIHKKRTRCANNCI